MALTIICILLGLAALYGGGMWVWMFIALTRLGRENVPERDRAAIELFTFHLGLCFIIALGFLGVILAIGG